MELKNCPACGGPLETGLSPWHRVCTRCTYEGSVLQPSILHQRAGGDLNESSRRAALEPLRKSNFGRVLSAIENATADRGASGLRLLDVGCAHGWFLELAAERGLEVAGIEPDSNVKQLPSIPPASIRRGFFPNVLGETERFDVISFNDVLEHIPDIEGALEACKLHLAERGILVVNAPDRTGILYRLSKVLYRLGLAGTFGRMWQEGFPSPHVHYLDRAWFQQLVSRHGFEVTDTIRLDSIALDGLYSRIRIDPAMSPLKAAMLAGAIAAALPALKVAPSDIRVWVLKLAI